MEAVDLATVTVGDDVLEAVPRTVAEIYKIVPLRFENGGRDVVIATADPQNLDALTDLGFMLSRRILSVRADREAIMAAIERVYVPRPLARMPEALSEMEGLDARGLFRIARDWLRRVSSKLWRLVRRSRGLMRMSDCAPHVRFSNHVLLATAESGAREGTVEISVDSGRFHYVTPGGERVEYGIPRRWARRIIRRIAWLAKGFPENSIPEGRIELNIRGKPFNYDVARERIEDGERVVLRLVDRPLPED